MMISLQKSSKLVFVLLFSSITIFFGKTAGAEISATSEDASVLITNLEYLRLVSGSQKQLPQVTDLANTNPQFPSCPPRNAGQTEFTKVTDLAKTNFPVKSCPPNRMSQAESNSNRQEVDPQDLPPVPQPRVDELEIDQKSPTKKPPAAEEEYIITPRVADEKKIHTRTTTIPINGVLINHLTQRKLSVGSRFGNNQNTIFDSNGIIKLNGQVQENLTTNNIFTVEQTGEYLQLQTVRQNREITVNLKEPRTVLGTELQLSITASCILPGANPNQICTYTPGLTSADINPDTQTPNRILQTANVGDVVEPETLAAIRQPGFQSGANGQEIGIDLFLPNTGSFVGNSTGEQLSITRREEIENTPTAIYSRIRQIVKVNDREAVMGRTVRGFSFILNDDNTLLNTALQLGYTLLPDILPHISSSENLVNANVNNNLFLAANNVRLPANSLTAYHGGVARAQSVPPEATNLKQVPAATFNSIWLGASPMIKRRSTLSSRFEEISPQTVLSSGGEEGGFTSNLSFVSNINNEIFSPANLQDYYSQVYVTILNQEVNNVTSNRYREETEYAPHLSFTGNITGTQEALRYYTGVIGAEEIKAYGGVDFSKNTANGWTFSGGVIGYVNPDIDYYSQVTGSIGKRISLSRNSNLVLSTGVNYALDRETRPNDFVNSITVRARANLGNVWFGLTNYFGDVLPDAIKNTLVTSVGIQFSNSFSLSGYYNLINENAARSVYGAGARLRLGKNQNSPTLNLSWRNNEYDYGRDRADNELKINENIFTVFLRGNF
ncbi:hypothetical protein PN483_01055 [Nodularia spumigena CS-591/04]|uniref:hypothetical protein n=1 Tax=Nodularia spumigena TaxID=70799 RepID=UPI00232CC4CA|nr:hypothetical protein [Nodularia spumigena]MDB9322434.1 hypothetical protein [Nodularia spumigena CS-591/07A]MDB9329104.1 hypothetical protein [Nodularia spumigena CS-591/04]MDB9362983.1 hypothetical protein [Nodularia spumigena CS-588/02]MDB9366584.1 hypothetical protein [Nodularia spumigena CS-588/02A10]